MVLIVFMACSLQSSRFWLYLFASSSFSFSGPLICFLPNILSRFIPHNFLTDLDRRGHSIHDADDDTDQTDNGVDLADDVAHEEEEN